MATLTLAEAERGRGWAMVLLGIILVGSSCCFFFFWLHIFQGCFDVSVMHYEYTRVGVWVGVSAIRAVVKNPIFSGVESGRPIYGTLGGRFVSRFFFFFCPWGGVGGGEGGGVELRSLTLFSPAHHHV